MSTIAVAKKGQRVAIGADTLLKDGCTTIPSYFLRADHGEAEPDGFESSGLTCLLANRHGIFGYFPNRSVIEYSRFFALGAGYEFALGAMYATYDDAGSAQNVVRTGLDA